MERFEDLKEETRKYNSLEEMIDDIPTTLPVAFNPNMRVGRYEFADEGYNYVDSFDVADWTNEEAWKEFLEDTTSKRYRELFESSEFREAAKKSARLYCVILQNFGPADPDYEPGDEEVGCNAYNYCIK